MREEHFTGAGQENLFADAVKEPFAKFVFERPDLFADRRLGDVELRGRAAQTARFGDFPEIGKLVKIHTFSYRFYEMNDFLNRFVL
jgi:hypothetical protein